jgi:hypothetical protein
VTLASFPIENGPLGSASVGEIVIADFNLDGYPDLAGSCATTVAIVYGGDGGFQSDSADGGLQSTATFIAGDSWTWAVNYLAAGDFNNDGIPDLAAAMQAVDGGYTSGGYLQVAVYFGVPDSGVLFPDGGVWTSGLFVPPSSWTPDGPYGIVAGDLNGDGLEDFAVLGLGSGVTVFYQTDGGFNQVAIKAGKLKCFTRLAIGDLNGDGHLDLVVGGFDSCSQAVQNALVGLISQDGGFTSTTMLNIGPDAGGLFWIYDLVVSPGGLVNVLGDALQTFVYNADAGLVDVGDFPSPTSHSGSTLDSAVSVDFNGDGQPDLAALYFDVSNLGSSQVVVWLGSDGGYGTPATISLGEEGYVMAAGAVNGGTLPDIVYTDAVYDNNGVLDAGRAMVLKNSNSCGP